MKIPRFIIHCILVTTLLPAITARAQPNNIQAATNRSKLQDLSIHLKKRAEAAQQHAKDVAKRKGWPLKKHLPDGSFIELQELSPNGKPIYYITENANAADTVSTDELWPGGSTGLNLTGSGMTVGEWDGGGVLATHQELTGRVTQVDGPLDSHYHATHVAGTLIASGVDPNARGMSSAANLDAYDWNSDGSEMSDAAANGLLLSNHSYGTITGWTTGYSDPSCARTAYWFGNSGHTEDYKFGFYDFWTSYWDDIAYNAPYYLIVKSAGNDRNDAGPGAGVEYCVYDGSNWVVSTAARDDDCGPDGYDCISTKGTAKNILTVGAVNDIVGGYVTPVTDLVSMTAFSAWGPTDDGRIKPDIVANGSSLWSTYNGDDSDYQYSSGTSMSAPNATGSLLLLQQHYQNTHDASSMRAATLKALAIHTADEAGAADGPDYENGWGILNAKTAAQVISGDGGGTHQITEASLTNGETYEIQVNSGGTGTEIKATLVWTDPAGTPVATSVDPADLMLVNDLDLRITGNSTTYTPWILDPANPSAAATTGDNIRDNVEQVIAKPGAAGTYTIQVSHKGTLNSSPQAFSLVISNQISNDFALIASADFESGLPTGWSNNDLGPYGYTWVFDDPYSTTNRTGGSGSFALADRYSPPGCTLMDTELKLPSLDLSAYAEVLFTFRTHFSAGAGYTTDYTNVDISINGGGWQTVWDRNGGEAVPGPENIVVDITALAAGEADVIIRFHYANSTICYFWQVDDVKIYGRETTICFVDNDMDGYGTVAGTTVVAADGTCDAADSESTTNDDCNDSNAAIHPGATEAINDGVDQNCDAQELCYVDQDNDSYRPDGVSTVASVDLDCLDSGEAVAGDPIGDCNDTVAGINPGATEVVGDGVDQDCNSQEICYVDQDNDSYRPDALSTVASADIDCLDSGEAVPGDPTGDCNDTAAGINPGATEIVSDGIDQDCNSQELCYVDQDNDTYRLDALSTIASVDLDCLDSGEAIPGDPTGDCNDTAAEINPGATEIVGDGIDQDCNSQELCYVDQDNDGYRPDAISTIASVNLVCTDSGEAIPADPTGDCDDSDPLAFPDQTWYKDQDGDGYSDGTTVIACERPVGYYTASELIQTTGDPDDTNPNIIPYSFPWTMFLPAISGQ